MGREILFKAKRKDNGKWVGGGSIIQFEDDGVRTFYIPQYNEKCICDHDYNGNILSFKNCIFYEIDPETLCQYTGLQDKNRRRAFENDKIKTLYANCPKNTHIEIIVFHEGAFRAESKIGEMGKCWSDLPTKASHLSFDKSVYMIEFEIIGNIHDEDTTDG